MNKLFCSICFEVGLLSIAEGESLIAVTLGMDFECEECGNAASDGFMTYPGMIAIGYTPSASQAA